MQLTTWTLHKQVFLGTIDRAGTEAGGKMVSGPSYSTSTLSCLHAPKPLNQAIVYLGSVVFRVSKQKSLERPHLNRPWMKTNNYDICYMS